MKYPKRNPSGLVIDKPIALRLMPEERREAEKLASRLNVSLSNLARTAYLAGLLSVSQNDSTRQA